MTNKHKLVVAAHQPNFMPYLGFFDKLKKSDIFVIRDEVQFTKRDFHHRNKIRINGIDNIQNPQYHWIGIPVYEEKKYLKDIKIKKDAKRGTKHWKKSLEYELQVNYETSNYYYEHFDNLMYVINNSSDSLMDANMELIYYIAQSLDINTRNIIKASDLVSSKCKLDTSEDLAKIVREIGGTTYLSGSGGKNYLDKKPFEEKGIEVVFQDFKHPYYPQNFDGFLENMSAIDALFCVDEYVGKEYEYEYKRI